MLLVFLEANLRILLQYLHASNRFQIGQNTGPKLIIFSHLERYWIG